MASKSPALPGGAPNTPPNGPQPSKIQTSPNLVAFDPKSAVPQQPLYLQRNDQLVFLIATNLGGFSVRIDYRWLTPEGEIKEGEINTPALFGASNVFIAGIYEGWLLSFAARTSGGQPGLWYYLQAAITRAPAPTALSPMHSVFWQGFIYANASNGWPGTATKEITDGPGTLRSIQGTAPGAGNEILETVPNQRRWTLLALRAQLSTSAAAGNRQAGFALDDGANLFYQIHSSTIQVASQVAGYCLAPGNQFFNDTQAQFLIPLPTVTALRSGYRIRSTTTGLLAGDQWQAIQYVVLEWGTWDQ
jgi:hypothetical protein